MELLLIAYQIGGAPILESVVMIVKLLLSCVLAGLYTATQPTTFLLIL